MNKDIQERYEAKYLVKQVQGMQREAAIEAAKYNFKNKI